MQATTGSRRSTTNIRTGTTLSKFDYTYDAAGNILMLRAQADTMR